MKNCVRILSVIFLLGCSGDSTTGSTVFVSEGLVVLGNPSILGESTGTPDAPSAFISVGGAVESQLGLPLTNVRVMVRVLDANGVLLGSREEACSPSDILPGGSCTFVTGVVMDTSHFSVSRTIEITPGSDQGTGTPRPIPVEWPDQ